MGTYLSKPITDKESQDSENDALMYGASSMQGWRISQEDAHNCILDFDKKISLFAVYDGHGGAEVALYAAENLPSFVKNELYEKGDYEKALIKAYLDFDSTLIEDSVVDKLNDLRELQPETELVAEDDGVEELNELYEEASLPIHEIIKKYRSIAKSDNDDDDDKNVEDDNKNDEDDKNKDVDKSINSDELKNSKVKDDDQPGTSQAPSSPKSKTKIKEAVANGVKENKSEDTCEIAQCSSSAKVNGTSDNDDEKNETDEAKNNKAACISSSGTILRRTRKSSDTMCLISDNLEIDSDSDEDDEDQVFELGETDSEDSDEDDDEDDDEDEDEDDSIMMDDEDDEEKVGKDSGCTAVMALLVNNKLYVANAGDSRCVVSIDGKAHDMSTDHKPEDEPEFKRISAAGGRVSSDGRVNGGLNLSRALGDHNYKKNADIPNTEQMITALPEVNVFDIIPGNDNFLVLACDGIWNSLSSQEVVDFVSERINKPDVKLSSICEELFDQCLAPNTLSDGTGCDNMTCIIVKLKHNQKRPHPENESDESNVGAECKKLKSDSTES